MNNRRRLVIALGACASTSGNVFAQAKKPPVVIGWLHGTGGSNSQATLAAFKEGMAALQYKEGTSYVIEARWAEGRVEWLPTLAEEVKQRKPAVIVHTPQRRHGGRVSCLSANSGRSGNGRITSRLRACEKSSASTRYGERAHQCGTRAFSEVPRTADCCGAEIETHRISHRFHNPAP